MGKKEQQQKSRKSKSFTHSFFIICPVCGAKGLEVTQRTAKIPYFGDSLETLASCPKCSYRAVDFLPLVDKRAPRTQKVAISNKTLSLRVIKSKYCKISIPELGIEIEPGAGAESFISNVEGVLERIAESLRGIAKVMPEKKKETEQIIEKISQLRKGKLKATLIFEDETGYSKIVDESRKKPT